ncbi:MAG: hypothetical protein A2X94_13955 [Bdellovibrionales bacterium GWB1_55_8]|nr:MAG: hypothetical protein A2X94_13955 [Bdellovibrionales bacterium GWB1_55_8]
MAKPIKRRNIPERQDPGEAEPLPCSPGSIEQQLDMCEDGELRGDEVLHSHGLQKNEKADLSSEDSMRTNFSVDMSEVDREGDEMSGDEHSLGLQGDEQQELANQTESGIPGGPGADDSKLAGVSIRKSKRKSAA